MKQVLRIVTPDDSNTDFCMLGQAIRGEIVIVPKQDIEAAIIGYRTLMEVRGKLAPFKKKLAEKVLTTKPLLRAEQEYRIPFEYTNNRPTYRGKNIDKLIKFEAFVKKDKRNIFDKSQLKEAIYLHYLPNNKNYSVKDTNYKLPLKNIFFINAFPWVVMAFIVLAMLIESFQEHNNAVWFYIVICLIITAFSTLIALYIHHRKLSKKYVVEAQFKSSETTDFEVLLEHNIPAAEMKSFRVNYNIMECVVDDRGTSSTTHLRRLFTAKPTKTYHVPEGLNLVFPYPENKPKPMDIAPDARVYWELHIELVTNSSFMANYKARTEFHLE